MSEPLMEVLEARRLLSALGPGQVQLFDFTGDGVNDAILVNSGPSAIDFTETPYDSDTGAAGSLSQVAIADGAKFVTNAPVGLISGGGFRLASAQVGMSVTYRGTTYAPIDGATSAAAASIGTLQAGLGDVLAVDTTAGGIDKLLIKAGDLSHVYATGQIGTVTVGGNVIGDVGTHAGIASLTALSLDGADIAALFGSIDKIVADSITGQTIIDAGTIGAIQAGVINGGTTITSKGDLLTLKADTIENTSILVKGGTTLLSAGAIRGAPDIVNTETGATSPGTYINIRHIGQLKADTITGGDDGDHLFIQSTGGIDSIVVGTLDGGAAVAGGSAVAELNIFGTLGELRAGLISGGVASGPGSTAELYLSVSNGLDSLGNTTYGDVTFLRASTISGGEAAGGGMAVLNVGIEQDLVEARVGKIVGNTAAGTNGTGAASINIGRDIGLLVAGSISTGDALAADTGAEVFDVSVASIDIVAGRDIVLLDAGRIEAGTADSGADPLDMAQALINIFAGRDILAITANQVSGGTATGAGAATGIFTTATRNIEFIGAGRITGATSSAPVLNPAIQFLAFGDIGLVTASRIVGGDASGGAAPQAAVLIRADGLYVDENGVAAAGDIGKIVAGTIDGGTADGAGALAFVKISAAGSIDTLYADRILGGQAADGGQTYVDIIAALNLGDVQIGTISGSSGASTDSTVQIQACNDILSFVANRIVAGDGGIVNILAGIDAEGLATGGDIESMVVGLISGAGGVVNIAAGGDIVSLEVSRIVTGADGEVNIVAVGNITADVSRIRSWALDGETGVDFVAGGTVSNTIASEYVTEGATDPLDDIIADLIVG